MGQPYSNPRNVAFSFNAVNFGTTTTRYVYIPPDVDAAFLRQIMACVTTSFVGTSSPANIEVGISGTLAKFGTLTLGSAAAEPVAPSGLAAYNFATGITSRNPGALPFAYAAGGTLVYVTFNAPVGGSPAGVADVTLSFDMAYSG